MKTDSAKHSRNRMGSIPNNMRDITTDWLNSVLRQGSLLGTDEITNISMVPTATQGMTSSLIRINLEFKHPDSRFPSSLIAKLRPTSEETFSQFRAMGHYHREVGFYRDIAHPGLSIPICYHAAEDSTGAFVLLLEDLGLQRELRPNEDVGNALQQIAGLHAKWWGGDELTQFDWCNVANKHALMNAWMPLLDARVEQFIAGNAAQMVPTRIIDFLQAWVANYPKLFDFHNVSPLTLTHGDLSPAQLFIPEDDHREIMIVDWQQALPLTGAADVSRLISLGLGQGLATNLVEPLITSYLDKLSAKGVEQYPRRDFELDYCLGLAVVMESFVGHTVGLEPSKTLAMQPYFDGLLWAFDNHKTIDLLPEYVGW